MSSDTVKRNPAVKDMKSVISQFEQKGKENAESVAQKPSNPTGGVKPASTAAKGMQLHKALPTKQESGSSPLTTTTLAGKLQSTVRSQPEEATTNQFKVTLKPVKPSPVIKPPNEADKIVKPSNTAKPDVHVSESSVSSKSKMFENNSVKDGRDDAAETSASGESLVGSRSRKFETLPRQTEKAGSSNALSSSATGSSTKEGPPPGNNHSYGSNAAASKPAPKSPFVAGTTHGSNGIGSSSLADKGKKVDPTEPECGKGLVQQSRNDGSQEAVKSRIKAFVAEQESKVSTQRPANTQDVAGKSGTLTKKTRESSEQTAINKAGSKEENSGFANEHLKMPSRAREKQLDKTNHPIKTTAEETDQPKIPPRNEEKTKDTKTVEKTLPSKKSTTINQQSTETKQTKIQDKFNQSATNKNETGNLQSLLRNKTRPVPPPTEQKGTKYRLLPVPKPSGNAPRKPAKPPAIDLGKFLADAKSKGLPVRQSQDLSSAALFEDGDDLYEECETAPLRISEYTEEEELQIEKMAKEKLSHKNDDHGKTVTISHEEYADDDEIYQEID